MLKRPTLVPEYAQACLDALSASGYGANISLGGAFGLAHYYEYRPTHDVDAWWVEPVAREERLQVVHLLEETLKPFGQVSVRSWGDVTSIELSREGRTVFSFQIAHRSAQLESPVSAPWTGIMVDTLTDLVASKMVALVERGAPRDFRDIYTLCQNQVVTAQQCWNLWRQRQELAKEDASTERARLAVLTHLARIEQHRPLLQITDVQDRSAAERLRIWFVTEFLNEDVMG